MSFEPDQAVQVLVGRAWFPGVVIEMRSTSKVRVLVDGADSTDVVPIKRVRAVAAQKPMPSRPQPTLEQAIERHGLVPASRLERPALRAVPKPPKPLRSEAYLAYVRRHPCCLCGRTQNIEAHHHGPHGAGQKTDDYRAAPLCDACHRAEFHQHGCLPGMTRAETDAFLYGQERELLLGWLATRPDDDASDIHLVIVDALVAHIRTKGAA